MAEWEAAAPVSARNVITGRHTEAGCPVRKRGAQSAAQKCYARAAIIMICCKKKETKNRSFGTVVVSDLKLNPETGLW